MSVDTALFLTVVCNFSLLAVSILVFYSLRLPIYHPGSLYLGYFFLGYCMRPLTILLLGESDLWLRIGYPVDAHAIGYSSVMSGVSLVALVAGTFLAHGGRIAPLFSSRALFVARPERFVVVAVTLTGLGLLGTFASYGLGGTDEVLAHTISIDASGGQRLEGVSGYQTALAEFLPPLLIILLLSFGMRYWVVALIAAYGVLRFYIGAQRLSIVVVVLAAVFIQATFAGKRFVSAKVIVFAVSFLFVFDLVGGDRLALRRIFAGESSVSQVLDSHANSRGGSGLGSDFKEFDVATVIYDVVPELTGYNYGTQYLRLLIWPIPRQLWPEKPVYTSLIDLNRIGNFFGLTWSLNADLYSNIGPASLFIGMLTIGWLLGRFYLVAAGTMSVMTYCSYWMFLVYISTLFRDGGVTVAYFFLFSMVAVFALVRSGALQLYVLPQRTHSHA